MAKVFISTGEPSGDLYGSIIAKELWAIDDQLIITGIGSNLMQASNVNIIQSSQELTTFGFYEGVKNYPKLRKVFHTVSNYLDSFQPDIFLAISFSGFNLRLARKMKKLGVKVVYFGPPQLWAWGRWRAKELRNNTDKVICLFPFEQEFFRNLEIDAIFLGNPLVDYIKQQLLSNSNILDGIPLDSKIITFMPGSRKEEIRNHLPLMLKIFMKLKDETRNLYGFVIIEPNDSFPRIKNLCYTKDKKYQIMAKSDLIVLGSGTASLEAAILGIPHIALYHLSLPSYLIAQILVKTKSFSLTNIILSEAVVPEFIQPTFSKIYPMVSQMLNNPNDTIREKLLKIKNLLGNLGAAKRIAEAILS